VIAHIGGVQGEKLIPTAVGAGCRSITMTRWGRRLFA
jgi:hypothetical protein